MLYIPNYIPIFIYFLSIITSSLLLFNFIVKVDKANLGIFKWIIFVLIILSLILIIFIQLNLICDYFDLNTLYADNGDFNPKLCELSDKIQEGVDNIVRERIAAGNNKQQITLSEIGWRHASHGIAGRYTNEINLFERFIDRNPHLSAFNAYYRMEFTGMTTRLYKVLITEDLLNSLRTCKDLTI